jgi:hypothetical protein
MNLIHEVDPAVNYYPMYSVEYRLKKNPLPAGFPQPWSQHYVTHNKWEARLARIESFLARPVRYEHRVRVL